MTHSKHRCLLNDPHSVDAPREIATVFSYWDPGWRISYAFSRSAGSLVHQPLLTICGSGIPRYRFHLLGPEDRRWVTRVVLPNHSTIIRGLVQVTFSTRGKPRRHFVGLGHLRPGEGAEQCNLPTMNRNLTDSVDLPWTGLVRLPSCFTQEFDRRIRKRQSVHCSPTLRRHVGRTTSTIEKLHPCVDAQTLA